MPRVARFRKALLTALLVGMLSPYALNLTSLAGSAQVEVVEPLQFVKLTDYQQHVAWEPPPAYGTGGTVILDQRAVFEIVECDGATRRPYIKPRPPWLS